MAFWPRLPENRRGGTRSGCERELEEKKKPLISRY